MSLRLQTRPRLRGGVRALAPALACFALAVFALVLAGCGGDDAGPSDGNALAERWLRLGEDAGTSVVVYERALPPMLSDLLNPGASPTDADDDTDEADRTSLPVHPDGELLGSYLLRRPDGSYLVWLFYDLEDADVGGVTSALAQQLDQTPWQVVSQQGNRAYTVVQFQNTRGDDLGGTAIVERQAATDTYDLAVERDGSEVTLHVERAAATPLLEAALADDLTVDATEPGLARDAGLREGDRILRVGATDVATQEDLDHALAALGDGPGPVAVTYLLQVAAPTTAQEAAYIPQQGLTLPEEFPLHDALADMTVDQYQTVQDPSGDFYGASLLTTDSTTDVTGRLRDALVADGWEIVSDEPVGFATTLGVTREADALAGSVSIDQFAEDEAFTQVVVSIQTATSGG